MKCSASLLGLNVGDYFNLCNWQLLPSPSHNYLPQQAKITDPHRPILLSTLSVKEFFGACNWQLILQNELDRDNDSNCLPPPQVETDLQNPIILRCLTVAGFFSLCNWQSLPPEVRQLQPLPLELPESPLKQKSPKTWQVEAFFQHISWEGSPEIGRLPQATTLSTLIPASAEMNLNDLSNLF